MAGLAAIAGGWLVAVAPPVAAVLPCQTSGCLIANDDNYTTSFDTKLSVSAVSGLLANDSGPASTSVDLQDTDIESWNGAKVSVHRDGSFSYIPDPTNPFSGQDSFDYTIQDTAGDWDFATAYIQVNPIPQNDSYATKSLLVVAAPGVFANDLGLDPDTALLDTTSAHGGTIVDDNDGAFEYTPPAGFQGIDTFTYTAMDLDWDDTYTATVSVLVDTTPPIVSMSAPSLVTLSTKVVPKWSGADASGIAWFDAQTAIAPWNGNLQGWANWKTATTVTSATLVGTYGRTFCFRVRATDRAGNVSGWVQRCTAVPLRASSMTYSAGWTGLVKSSYYAGSAVRTTTKGAKASRTSVQARRLWLVATTCATCGTLQVRWNNVVVANLNLHATTTAYRQLFSIASFSSVQTGTLTLTVTSPAGKTVNVEGLTVFRA